jgi:peptidoglycan/xylan/chitin deacetylase (PgdA/CDA1 family)
MLARASAPEIGPQLASILLPLAPDALATDGVPDVARLRGPVWLQAGGWRLLASLRLERGLGTGPDLGSPAGQTAEIIESFQLESGLHVSALRRSDGAVVVPFDFDDAYRNYITEAWRANTGARALGDRQLQLYYRVKGLLPREFWLALRRLIIRLGKPPVFPAWPLELGVDRLLRFYALCQLLAADAEEAPFKWFWPERYHAALILTHDVETGDGLRLALELADLEQERGLRSSFNVVAGDYAVDEGILRELSGRGFEIGLHGLHHDRSLFSSRAEFERQLPALAEAAERFGAVGFRSPSTYRVIDWLPELPVAYDCTVPHSDPYEPLPGGCCTLWPYTLGPIVELPYTLPQDHTLFTLRRTLSVEPWLEQASAIELRFGLIQCLSHPDRGYLGDLDKRALYRELLDALVERKALWHALPREVADWWRRREAGEAQAPELRHGTMRIGDPSEYAFFEPPPPAL